VLIINRNGVSDTIDMAHVHTGAVGATGPVLIPLEQTSADEWTSRGILEADDLATLLSGDTYFNTHTAANPDGFLRGQIANFF